MRVISKKPIREFWELHPESKSALEGWFRKVNQFTAVSFPELRQTFGTADFVDGYMIFDVGGNKYRIATVIHYDKQRIYIRKVMTHTSTLRMIGEDNENCNRHPETGSSLAGTHVVSTGIPSRI